MPVKNVVRRTDTPLPVLPEPFDLAVTRTVQRDCTVNFEGRSYSVPFVLTGLAVEVRGWDSPRAVLRRVAIRAAPICASPWCMRPRRWRTR